MLGRPREWAKGLWKSFGREQLGCLDVLEELAFFNCLNPSLHMNPRKVGFVVTAESSSLLRECMHGPSAEGYLLFPREGSPLEVGVLLLDQGTGWSFLHQKCQSTRLDGFWAVFPETP